MQEQINWRDAYPGEEVALPGTGQTITVYPLGGDQLTSFSAEVEIILTAIRRFQIDQAADPAAIGLAILRTVTPLLIGKAKALLNACCSRSLDGAPAKVLLPVAAAWIRQSTEGIDPNQYKMFGKMMLDRMNEIPSLRAVRDLLSKRSAPVAQNQNGSING